MSTPPWSADFEARHVDGPRRAKEGTHGFDVHSSKLGSPCATSRSSAPALQLEEASKDQTGPLGEMPRFEEKDADFELAWKLQREEQVSL